MEQDIIEILQAARKRVKDANVKQRKRQQQDSIKRIQQQRKKLINYGKGNTRRI